VIDGFTLNRAIITTARGGDWIDLEVKNEIDKSGKCSLFYLLKNSLRKYRAIMVEIQGYYRDDRSSNVDNMTMQLVLESGGLGILLLLLYF
jgi:hypothetical protein